MSQQLNCQDMGTWGFGKENFCRRVQLSLRQQQVRSLAKIAVKTNFKGWITLLDTLKYFNLPSPEARCKRTPGGVHLTFFPFYKLMVNEKCGFQNTNVIRRFRNAENLYCPDEWVGGW